ncbi:MAG: hypothetical protein ACQETL_19925 [Bacteroidota bacterium]
MFESIKKDLPYFPDQVIKDWLLPFAQDEGWPPTAERWQYLLKEKNLDRWRSASWELKELDFSKLVLSPRCMASLYALVRAYTLGEDNEYSRALGERGKERFHIQLHYLIDYGVFPSPPVLIDHGEGLEIMDGNHRVAALCVWSQWKDNPVFIEKLAKNPKFLRPLQPFWVGTFKT